VLFPSASPAAFPRRCSNFFFSCNAGFLWRDWCETDNRLPAGPARRTAGEKLEDRQAIWRAPEAIPEALDAKINSDAPATEQLDELEGWLDRQKDHDAGDWPTGEFTGGKHDRHDSSDNLKA
jgi:hypothetical protein